MLKQILKIDACEAEFSRRGFLCANQQIQMRLENVGRTFLRGYHTALQEKNQSVLAEKLDEIEPDFRGFAYEGAAMALALLDGISFRGNAFSHFTEGAGSQHVYMLHVGAGWAYARLPWKRRNIESAIKKLHPVLGWLAIDGYGFHEGYFHFKLWRSNQFNQQLSGARLSENACRVFCQGFGRSLWFVHGANVKEIAAGIVRFPSQYHPDMWSGIGLACAYAGGVERSEVEQLHHEAGLYRAALAQGVAFAAKARQLAGNPAEHTEIACRVLCQLSAAEAAAICDETFSQLDLHDAYSYQHWRNLIQQTLTQKDFISAKIPLRGKSHEPVITSTLLATKHH